MGRGSAPKTSTTLLLELAQDSQHARWAEFVTRYRPMMQAYMCERFPQVEADEAIAETLVALVEVLRHYRYSPAETGRFHNYLTGVLRHKALRILERERRQRELGRQLAQERPVAAGEGEEAEYQQALLNVAVGEFFNDEAVSSRTKEVFRHVALRGEPPEEVARAFQIERHAVDQIKSRSLARLRELIAKLEKARD